MTLVLGLQAGYYLLTGLWPLVHIPSFIAISGPKTDVWLVRTVGALTVAISLGLGVQLMEPPLAARVLGVASAIAFLSVDLVYVSRKVVGPIYLGDAFMEALFLVGWLVVSL